VAQRQRQGGLSARQRQSDRPHVDRPAISTTVADHTHLSLDRRTPHQAYFIQPSSRMAAQLWKVLDLWIRSFRSDSRSQISTPPYYLENRANGRSVGQTRNLCSRSLNAIGEIA
jgi:hypothetical protein